MVHHPVDEVATSIGVVRGGIRTTVLSVATTVLSLAPIPLCYGCRRILLHSAVFVQRQKILQR